MTRTNARPQFPLGASPSNKLLQHITLFRQGTKCPTLLPLTPSSPATLAVARHEPDSLFFFPFTKTLNLNITLLRIMATGKQARKKHRWSDKANVDKAPQTFRRRAKMEATRKKKKKENPNELVHLWGAATGRRLLASLNMQQKERTRERRRERKRSLGED